MIANSTSPVITDKPLKTQIDTVRAHLMSGATITTWDAYRLYQITSLAQRIHELRSAGLVIQSEMVTHNSKRFAVYWLDEQTLLESELCEVTP